MVMAPTLVSAASAGQDHDQNDPMGVRLWVLFEFLLYLIRKWSPDAHGVHQGVGGIGGSRPWSKCSHGWKGLCAFWIFTLSYQKVVPRCSWGPPWCRRRWRVSTMTRMLPRVQGIRYLWNFQARVILGGSRHSFHLGQEFVTDNFCLKY